MKRKTAVSLSLVLLLGGCGSTEDVLGQHIASATVREIRKANQKDRFVSYYLQKEDGILKQEGTCTQFSIQGKCMWMNLRVEDIVRSVYYTDVKADDLPAKPYRHESGSYTDVSDDTYDYSLYVYGSGRIKVMLVRTAYEDFMCVGTLDEIADCGEEAIAIARSLKADRDAVIKAYSKRNDITYTTDSLELFQTLVPEEGGIDEILIQDSSATASPGTGEEG